DPTGNAVAAIVRSLNVELHYPEYLGMASTTESDPMTIRAHMGTEVTLRVEMNVEATDYWALVGTTKVALEGSETLEARFVIHGDASLSVHARRADGEITDRSIRLVRAIADRAPAVRITTPSTDLAVDDHTEVPV